MTRDDWEALLDRVTPPLLDIELMSQVIANNAGVRQEYAALRRMYADWLQETADDPEWATLQGWLADNLKHPCVVLGRRAMWALSPNPASEIRPWMFLEPKLFYALPTNTLGSAVNYCRRTYIDRLATEQALLAALKATAQKPVSRGTP